MRLSNLFVFALSGASLAMPVAQEKRQSAETSVQTLLTDLYATVQIYTGAINATLAPLSPSSSILEKTAAIPEVGAQISKITAAITSTTASIKELAPANATQPTLSSRSDSDVLGVAQHKEKRQLIAVRALLALIIVEIFATVTAAVAILGLAGLLVFLNPLTSALSLLILAVQLVLDVVLVSVIALLNSLLTALALGVSGL
ncbi:Tymo-45kd-70kd domain-containing protein [Pyrenophora tritici-repentis]|nr:Tymo-45kd-70kd domain-containing protein [Pyrenophora tritici-repentis]KAI0612613.1 Tymo-45kd-70kd domain-containing protein [Pyrenophora tritici-repentis]KAI0624785.1 Tymo-45kd-70kd domain-containing protein [Pyrenophora tritici-repentis]